MGATVFINGVKYEVDATELTGIQLRAIAALDTIVELVVEGLGSEPDRVLANDEKIAVGKDPIRVFARPPTSFGVAWLA